MITDIHTHDIARWQNSIVSCTPGEYRTLAEKYPDALFSVGIHPWDTQAVTDEDLQRLTAAVCDHRVVAIGETGLDSLRGASLDDQEIIFRRHIELSELVKKPLIIHCVKGWDRLLALHAEMKPAQNWAIHGFRGKPQLARQLVDRGIWLSLGPRFNHDVLDEVPVDKLLTESDEADSVPMLPGHDPAGVIARFLQPRDR